MSFHYLQLSPRKYVVIEADTGTSILNGQHVSNCGHAKIVFGPASSLACSNQLAILASCQFCKGKGCDMCNPESFKGKADYLYIALQRKRPFTGEDADLSSALQAYIQGVDIKTLWTTP